MNAVFRISKLNAALCALIALACSNTSSVESAAHHNFVLVGSTACDAPIKAALSIAPDTKCDFIRWRLAIDSAKSNAFSLDANYGEGQPNTSGFIGGGHRLTAAGKSETNMSADKRETIRFRSDQPKTDFTLLKLNANLFHLLMTDGKLMVGDGGWSYTLNRNPALASSTVPASIVEGSEPSDAKIVFEGRTPCREISQLAGVPFGADCFKLKWKLTLNRDATSLQPTTFMIESTFAREKPITGKWSRTKTGGGSIVYRLEPDSTAMKPISLLMTDPDHLYFLDSSGRPLVGNADFSYTLDRSD